MDLKKKKKIKIIEIESRKVVVRNWGEEIRRKTDRRIKKKKERTLGIY